MHHSARIIERIAIDGHARTAGFLEEHHQLADRDALVHRFDIGSRHHDILDAHLAEAQDVVEHRPLAWGKGRVAFRIGQKRVGNILAQARSVGRLEKARGPAPQGIAGLLRAGGTAALLGN